MGGNVGSILVQLGSLARPLAVSGFHDMISFNYAHIPSNIGERNFVYQTHLIKLAG